MPDAIGADAPASSGDTKPTTPGTDSNAPSGTGLVSEEAVQKGYVWMNEVNNNVFDTTYEDLVDYFGVEGEFVKEEYSDHMKRNQRYYKWVSKDDSTAFGAGAIRFEVRGSVEDFDYYKDDFENYQDIDDRVIGGITFKGRTYKYIGYNWIQYVAQIGDGRALSIGLTKLDCVPGTMPDVILSGMTIK